MQAFIPPYHLLLSSTAGPFTIHSVTDSSCVTAEMSFITCLLTFMPGMRVQDYWEPSSHLLAPTCHHYFSVAPGSSLNIPLVGTHGHLHSHPFPFALSPLSLKESSLVSGRTPTPLKLTPPSFHLWYFLKHSETSPFPLRWGVWKARSESNFISEVPLPGQWWGCGVNIPVEKMVIFQKIYSNNHVQTYIVITLSLDCPFLGGWDTIGRA